jgi:hypothetical protein
MWPFRSIAKRELGKLGVIVRYGAVELKDISLFKVATDKAYEAVEAARTGIEPQGPHAELIKHIAQSTIQWGGIPICQVLDIAAFPETSEAFARIVKQAEKAVTDLSGYSFKGVYRAELSYVRRHKGSSTHVPWHFDAGAAGMGTARPGRRRLSDAGIHPSHKYQDEGRRS